MDVSSADVLFCKRVPVAIRTHTTNHFHSHQTYLEKGKNVALSNTSSSASPPNNSTSLDGYMSSAFEVNKRVGQITVQVAMDSSRGGGIRTLDLRLTDESNPFFLFYLSIGEDDFHTLKQDQNLLVDFQMFPEKFIELLEQCIAAKGSLNPKYIAQLSTPASCSPTSSSHTSQPPANATASFSIIETNSFRNITHLSLQFIPGNDSNVKKYLAALVRDFKEESLQLRTKLHETTNDLTAQLTDKLKLLDQIKSDYDHIKIHYAEEITKLKLIHSDELTREREKWQKERENFETRFGGERRQELSKLEEELKTANKSNQELNVANSRLLGHCSTLESQVATMTREFDALKREHSNLVAQQSSTREEFKACEKRCSQLERECEGWKRKSEEQERRLDEWRGGEDKWESIRKTWDGERAKMQENIQLYKSQNSKLETECKQLSEDVKKGNEIIQKLQNEFKTVRSKLKLKHVISLQQEKLLEERQSAIEQHTKDIATLREDLDNIKREMENKAAEIKELKQKLETSENIVKENANVIEWLHKQLNEKELNKGRYGPTSYGTGTTNLYSSALPTSALDDFQNKKYGNNIPAWGTTKQPAPPVSSSATGAYRYKYDGIESHLPANENIPMYGASSFNKVSAGTKTAPSNMKISPNTHLNSNPNGINAGRYLQPRPHARPSSPSNFNLMGLGGAYPSANNPHMINTPSPAGYVNELGGLGLPKNPTMHGKGHHQHKGGAPRSNDQEREVLKTITGLDLNHDGASANGMGTTPTPSHHLHQQPRFNYDQQQHTLGKSISGPAPSTIGTAVAATGTSDNTTGAVKSNYF